MSDPLPRSKKITSFNNILLQSPKVTDNSIKNSADVVLTLPSTAGTLALTSDITTATTGAVSETGTQTLTNKTLITPTIASITNGEAVITMPSVSGTVALNADLTSLSERFDRLLTYLEDWVEVGNITMEDVKTVVNGADASSSE